MEKLSAVLHAYPSSLYCSELFLLLFQNYSEFELCFHFDFIFLGQVEIYLLVECIFRCNE